MEHLFFDHPKETKIDLENRVFREVGCWTEGREMTNLIGVIRSFVSLSVGEIGIPLWGGSRKRRGAVETP